MTVRTRVATLKDLAAFRGRAIRRETIAMLRPHLAFVMCQSTAYAFEIDGQVRAIAGLDAKAPARADVWLLVEEGAERHRLALIKALGSMFALVSRARRIRIVDALIDTADDRAQRFARLFGFSPANWTPDVELGGRVFQPWRCVWPKLSPQSLPQ